MLDTRIERCGGDRSLPDSLGEKKGQTLVAPDWLIPKEIDGVDVDVVEEKVVYT